MAGQLRLAATEGSEHGKGEQFTGGDVQAGAGEVVAEAVGRQPALGVLFVLWSGSVEGLDPVRADDLLLHREALLVAGLGCGR